MLDRAAKTLASATYAAGAGSERHRAAGAAWVGRGTDPSRIVVTAGTQHAILLAFAATARAGDTILTESITYHGAKSVAAMLGIKLQPLPLDRYGIEPDAFERAVRGRGAPRVLYTIPSLHNPTGIVFPEKRRRDLAASVRAHRVGCVAMLQIRAGQLGHLRRHLRHTRRPPECRHGLHRRQPLCVLLQHVHTRRE